MSSGDVLDAIDGAILAWETSNDAMRWIPAEKRDHPHVPAVTSEQPVFDLDLSVLRVAMARFVEGITAAVEQVGEQLLQISAQLSADVPDPTPEPAADVRQRALDAVRNRNTGPAIRRRAPRELGLGRRRS